LRHKTPINKSSFLLTDGALAEWVALQELGIWSQQISGGITLCLTRSGSGLFSTSSWRALGCIVHNLLIADRW